jgi:hypothetical protein
MTCNSSPSTNLPKRYSLENLPVPNNKAVTVEKIPSHKVAVLRFSGLVNERTLKKKRKELQTWITEQKIHPQGNLAQPVMIRLGHCGF